MCYQPVNQETLQIVHLKKDVFIYLIASVFSILLLFIKHKIHILFKLRDRKFALNHEFMSARVFAM